MAIGRTEVLYKNICPGGGIGRHAGLKILFAAMRVTVQLRSGAHLNQSVTKVAFMRPFLFLQIFKQFSNKPISHPNYFIHFED